MIFKQFYKWEPKVSPLFKKGETIIIGHRGAPLIAHENTLESFNKAFKANLKGVELDIQLTKDEKIIIFHDLKIKTNNKIFKKISSLNYLDISLIAKKNGFKVLSSKGGDDPNLAAELPLLITILLALLLIVILLQVTLNFR